MNTPAAIPENTEILPAGLKIDGDPLERPVRIVYEETTAGTTAKFSTVDDTRTGRIIPEGRRLLAAAGTATGKTRAEAREKVINALAAEMVG
ncbi:MAG: hypothetical protein PHO20_00445 [Candidatus Peribacteraceae bacterium]|nr:hypothetical protein [Candidatus Peribacteraceae bacterium]MDD5739223.1 hypothetical protein [Candidatus Peribacteraceae bacterium]